ncbi:MAG: hypothetical protein A2018_03625 [Alphaproteobacteria bacterium GWF2_58_20]|nr:MAG: hypothetical protein A2018_03625 [Alphaproteobacteria bacterium GWF2_58_20]
MVQGIISKSVFILLLTVQASRAESLVQEWKIRMAGLPAAQASLTFNITPTTYVLHMSARMAGPLSMLFSWKNESESSGLITRNGILVQSHGISNKWQDKTSNFLLNYSLEGNLTGRVDTPPLAEALPPPDPVLASGTQDFLSALVAGGLFISRNDACPKVMPVHDGRRRYDVAITDAGMDNINGQPARHCRMDISPFTPEGGKRPKGWFWKRNGKGKRPDPINIWMAQNPTTGIAVPVKCTFTSDVGDVEMLLNRQ